MRDEWTGRIARRLELAGTAVDADVVVELGQHAAAAYESARAEGLDPEAARARVEQLIDAWVVAGPQLKHRSRVRSAPEPPSDGAAPLAGLLHDLRYAWRLSWRQPGPTTVAALTMALAIAATTTLFSVTWSVLMKPLAWRDPGSLIRVHETREGATRAWGPILTNGSYLAWRAEGSSTIEALAAYTATSMTLTGAGDPQRVRVSPATASLAQVLRVAPLRGRFFTASDEPAANVLVISHAFWQRQFGGAEDAVGRALTLDGRVYTIVGVMPPKLAFPDEETIAWVPMHVGPPRTPDGGSRIQMFAGIGRLKAGVTTRQAAEEATARARSAPDPGMAVVAVFGSKGAPVVHVETFLDSITSDVRPALWVLLAAVGLLLLTATANIASVQLARAASRRREFAIRVSLGAGGGRLARQLVFESLVIGVVGGVAGLAIAALIHGLLPTLLPADFPRARDISLDWRAASVAALAALCSSVFFGLVPALQARGLSPRGAMADGGAAVAGGFRRSTTARLRAGIMAGQVAVACVLLTGAVLLGRTFVAMVHADRGYDASNVLTARVASPDGLFSAERRTAMVTRALERLGTHPGVIAAGYANNLPLLPGESMMAMTLFADDRHPEPRQVQTSVRLVSPGYVEAMGMRVVEGRAFRSTDTAASRPVLVVNRTFAARYLRERPVGTILPASLYDRTDWEIVGIVDDVRMRPSLTEDPGPEMFVSYTQTPRGILAPPVLVVRTQGDPSAMIDELRTIVTSEEPSAALESVLTMEQRLMGSLARPRLYAVVLVGFAVFALLIAAVGLFGVLSYSVAQRARELGVRAVLGAGPRQIVGLVVREGLVISLAGIVAGTSAAVLSSRALASFLYGVSPVDPWSYAAVAALLLAVAALACAVPARRAAAVDPLTVLKVG